MVSFWPDSKVVNIVLIYAIWLLFVAYEVWKFDAPLWGSLDGLHNIQPLLLACDTV